MCLIAQSDKGKGAIPRDHLENAMERNSDGWGFMYARDGRVIWEKGNSGANAFFDAWGRVPDDTACAVHFRFATKGAKDDANCHPFEVLNVQEHGVDLYVMHNGPQIMDCHGDKERSDTAEFVQDVLRPQLALSPALLTNAAWLRMIENAIGKEKLVFLSGLGTWHFVNRKQGTDKEGVWYSNAYSIEKRAPKYDHNADYRQYYGAWNGYGSYHERQEHLLLGDDWEQTKGGAWVRKGTGAIPTGATSHSVVPFRAARCPNRGNRDCRMGCKIGDTCVEPTPAEKRAEAMRKRAAKQEAKRAQRELAARIKAAPNIARLLDAKFACPVSGRTCAKDCGEHECKAELGVSWKLDDLRAMSGLERFHQVISDPEGCERFLIDCGCVVRRGVASKMPEDVADLISDFLEGKNPLMDQVWEN